MLERAARLFHTVRHLRPAQICGRVWFRIHRPRPDPRPAPELRPPVRQWIACPRAASMTGPARFRMLNVEHELASATDWNSPVWSKLWLYNLHYFDDLNADGACDRSAWHEALIARWIQENPPARGNGWEPYPLSLRIVNWSKWSWRGGRLVADAAHSLAVQARYLRQRMEVHLLGNHLLANAKALVFAGAAFAGPEADGWRETGLGLVRRELREQILPDGGHFERSPMYHSIILEDVLDLIQLAALFPRLFADEDLVAWRGVVSRMLHWLAVMTHPDGRIALFNDAAFGIAPEPGDLAAHARTVGVSAAAPIDSPLVLLGDTGYARLSRGQAVLIADVGAIGPDYLPAHAHADTLSFELSVAGRRVVVDAGTSLYDVGPERLWQRGTAAHNTVEIDGRNSSEIWSSFRVARRARPFDVTSGVSGEAVWLSAAHDGYRRLPGRPVHRRRWELCKDRLRVRDEIEGGFARAVARLRLHPAGQVERGASAFDGRLRGYALPFAFRIDGAAAVNVVESAWHPEFGRSEPCRVVEATFGGPVQELVIEW